MGLGQQEGLADLAKFYFWNSILGEQHIIIRQCLIDADESNFVAGTQVDDRHAVGNIIGRGRLHLGEAGEACEADQMDLIANAGTGTVKAHDRIVARAHAEIEMVIALTAFERVGTQAAGQAIGPYTADEVIIARCAIESVIVRVAQQAIILGIARCVNAGIAA